MKWRWRRRRGGNRATIKRITYTDPLHTGRHPFQTYLCVLCIVSGLPIIIGHVGASSIESQMPFWLAYCWGWALFLGAAIGLVGAYWPGEYDSALTIERAGLAMLGTAAALYAIVILTVDGWDRLIPAAITFAFGFACIRRALDIGRIIRLAVHNLENENG